RRRAVSSAARSRPRSFFAGGAFHFRATRTSLRSRSPPDGPWRGWDASRCTIIPAGSLPSRSPWHSPTGRATISASMTPWFFSLWLAVRARAPPHDAGEASAHTRGGIRHGALFPRFLARDGSPLLRRPILRPDPRAVRDSLPHRLRSGAPRTTGAAGRGDESGDIGDAGRVSGYSSFIR